MILIYNLNVLYIKIVTKKWLEAAPSCWSLNVVVWGFPVWKLGLEL